MTRCAHVSVRVSVRGVCVSNLLPCFLLSPQVAEQSVSGQSAPSASEADLEDEEEEEGDTEMADGGSMAALVAEGEEGSKARGDQSDSGAENDTGTAVQDKGSGKCLLDTKGRNCFQLKHH